MAGFSPEYLEELDLLTFNSLMEEVARQSALVRIAAVADTNQATQGDNKSIKAHLKHLQRAAGVRNTISRDQFLKQLKQ